MRRVQLALLAAAGASAAVLSFFNAPFQQPAPCTAPAQGRYVVYTDACTPMSPSSSIAAVACSDSSVTMAYFGSAADCSGASQGTQTVTATCAVTGVNTSQSLTDPTCSAPPGLVVASLYAAPSPGATASCAGSAQQVAVWPTTASATECQARLYNGFYDMQVSMPTASTVSAAIFMTSDGSCGGSAYMSWANAPLGVGAAAGCAAATQSSAGSVVFSTPAPFTPPTPTPTPTLLPCAGGAAPVGFRALLYQDAACSGTGYQIPDQYVGVCLGNGGTGNSTSAAVSVTGGVMSGASISLYGATCDASSLQTTLNFAAATCNPVAAGTGPVSYAFLAEALCTQPSPLFTLTAWSSSASCTSSASASSSVNLVSFTCAAVSGLPMPFARLAVTGPGSAVKLQLFSDAACATAVMATLSFASADAAALPSACAPIDSNSQGFTSYSAVLSAIVPFQPTPSPTPSPGPTPSPVAASVSASVSASAAASPGASAGASAGASPGASVAVSAGASVAASAGASPGASVAASAGASPGASVVASANASSSTSLTPTASTTPTASLSFGASASRTASRSLTGSRTPSNSRTPSTTTSVTPSSSKTPSVTATITPSPTGSLSMGASPSATSTTSLSPSPTPTSSLSPPASPSPSPSTSADATSSPSSTISGSDAGSPTPTVTPTASLSRGASPSNTPSGSAATSGAPAASGTPSASSSPPATCSDGVKNGRETDVDCGGGGPCAACSVGMQCRARADCDTTAGAPVVCAAASLTCTDTRLGATTVGGRAAAFLDVQLAAGPGLLSSAVSAAQLEGLRAAVGRAAANLTNASAVTALLRGVVVTSDPAAAGLRRRLGTAAPATVSTRVNVTLVSAVSLSGLVTASAMQSGVAAQLQTAAGALAAPAWAAANISVRAVAVSAPLPPAALVAVTAAPTGGSGGGGGAGAAVAALALFIVVPVAMYRLRTRGLFCGMRLTPLATCCGLWKHSADTRAILAKHMKRARGGRAAVSEDGGLAPVVLGNPLGLRVIGKAARKPQGLERPRTEFGPRSTNSSDV